MKRRTDLQTKVLWITYLILAFWFKDNLICNCLPTFVFFMAKAFMHLYFGMINEVEMLEIKNKCSSKDDWIVFMFYLAGVTIFFEFVFILILICDYRRVFISESPNYLILLLPNIGFAILNLLMALNIHKIKSIRENSNEVDTKIDENILLLKKHLEQFDKPLINIANSSKNNIKCFLEEKLDCEKQKVQVFVSEYSFENGYVKIPNKNSYGVILYKAPWKDVKPLLFNRNQVFHCLQINDLKTQQVLYKNYKKNKK